MFLFPGDADFAGAKLVRRAPTTNYLFIITTIGHFHPAEALIRAFLAVHMVIFLLVLVLFPVLTHPVHRHRRAFLVINRVWDGNSVREDMASSLKVNPMVRSHELGDVFAHIIHLGQGLKQGD